VIRTGALCRPRFSSGGAWVLSSLSWRGSARPRGALCPLVLARASICPCKHAGCAIGPGNRLMRALGRPGGGGGGRGRTARARAHERGKIGGGVGVCELRGVERVYSALSSVLQEEGARTRWGSRERSRADTTNERVGGVNGGVRARAGRRGRLKRKGAGSSPSSSAAAAVRVRENAPAENAPHESYHRVRQRVGRNGK
jgi:hypothetical protein